MKHLAEGNAVIAEIREIGINRVHPNCCLVCGEAEILRLCRDIKCRGLQEPIVVELVEYWFQIVDGEKRWRACKKIGWNTIKAIIVEVSLTESA